MVKSAASAASLRTKTPRRKPEKLRKSCLFGPLKWNPNGNVVFGAFRRQKRAFPKIKSLKMVLSITPRPFLKRPLPFSQYLASLKAKYIEEMLTNSLKIAFWGPLCEEFYRQRGQRSEIGGSGSEKKLCTLLPSKS